MVRTNNLDFLLGCVGLFFLYAGIITLQSISESANTAAKLTCDLSDSAYTKQQHNNNENEQ